MSEVEADGLAAFDDFSYELAAEAKRLKVVVVQEPGCNEFMPVLSYAVDTAIDRAEERVVELKKLRDRYSA
jgi:hypothetical protein